MPPPRQTGDPLASAEPPEKCPKCGQLHYREGRGGVWRVTCTAHRTNGQPCMTYPIRGGKVCGMHGGRAGQVRAKADANAEHQEMMAKITRGLTSAGIDLAENDPIKELLWAVAVSSQAVKWLAHRVAELKLPDIGATAELENVHATDDEGNPIVTPTSSRLYGPDAAGTLRTHPLWREWNAERMRHARFAKLAVDAGVSERMVRIAEAQAELVVETVLFALDQLRVSADIREQAVLIIGERFRAIEAESYPLGLSAPA